MNFQCINVALLHWLFATNPKLWYSDCETNPGCVAIAPNRISPPRCVTCVSHHMFAQ